jgi:SAM-dependent methyltransferase
MSLLADLREQEVFSILAKGDKFFMYTDCGISELSLKELYALSDEIRAIAHFRTPEIAEDLLARAKQVFADLPDSGEWVGGACSDECIELAWKFCGTQVFRLVFNAPFVEFRVVRCVVNCHDHYRDPRNDLRFILQYLKGWSRYPIALHHRLNKIFGESPENTQIFLGTGTGCGYGVYRYLSQFDPFELNGSADTQRLIAVCAGPIELEIDDYFQEVALDSFAVILSAQFLDDRWLHQVLAEFQSEDEAITWVEDHRDDLSAPEKFDAFLSKLGADA